MHHPLGFPQAPPARLGLKGQGPTSFIPLGIIVVISHHSKWFRLKDPSCGLLGCKFHTKQQGLAPKTYRKPRPH
jgi:hypothetical protein